GVYIDIFPLDGYPNRKDKQIKLELKKKTLSRKQYCGLNSSDKWNIRFRNAVLRLFGVHKHNIKILKKIESNISKFPTSKSDIWCNHGERMGKLEYMPKEWYGEGIHSKFEGIDVVIPEKYDKYLTQKYGDWRADLPKEQQIGHHYYEICDLNRSYSDYIEKLPNGKVKIKNPK
ncbi:MAG: LicD family protein, partial [Acutalibacteraceae bacterium]